jgi:hypothetical protein
MLFRVKFVVRRKNVQSQMTPKFSSLVISVVENLRLKGAEQAEEPNEALF